MMMKVPCVQGRGQAVVICRVARYGVSQTTNITLCVRQKVGVTSSKKFYPVGRIGPNERIISTEVKSEGNNGQGG